jgi:hypothetical protein
MNLIQTIENAQKKLSKLVYVTTIFIERKSYDENTNIIVCVKENGVCFMSKFNNDECFISLEDLNADDWEVVE